MRSVLTHVLSMDGKAGDESNVVLTAETGLLSMIDNVGNDGIELNRWRWGGAE